MPEYDRDRENFKNNERGRIFEDGTERYFPENERNGYKRGLEVPTDQGPRRYDKGKILRDGHILAVEDKSGRVIGENDIKEFYKDRELLDKGKVNQLLIRTVECEKISDKAKEPIKELQEKFGSRVVHQVIPRWQARETWAMGLELWKERQQQKDKQPRQLELIRTYESTRADRARKRLEKIREIVRAREAKAKDEPAREKEPQQRGVTKERDEQARENRARDERAPITPEPATRVVRELPTWAQILTREDNRENAQPPTRADRDAQALEMPGLEIKPGRDQEPPAPPPVPQRTPEQEHENARARAMQERDNARALARESGLSPQILGILGLNSNEPPKMIDVDQARAHAESERDRSIHQQRERERSEREREGRHLGE